MSDTGLLGKYIAANYVMVSSGRVSLLLEPDTLETAAALPGFLGATAEGALILDDTKGSLHAVELLSARELAGLAKERLSGRTLTPEEKEKFKAG